MVTLVRQMRLCAWIIDVTDYATYRTTIVCNLSKCRMQLVPCRSWFSTLRVSCSAYDLNLTDMNKIAEAFLCSCASPALVFSIDSDILKSLCSHDHRHWAAIVSRGWADASSRRLRVSLSRVVLCHFVSLQYLSMSSLHRLAGLTCRLFLSYVLQVVI